MGVDVLIGGVSYLAGGQPGQYCVLVDSAGTTTLKVDLDIALQQPRAEFDVVIWRQAIHRPLAGQEVIMLNALGQREFGGLLVMVEETELEPDVMLYHCTCSDYTKLLDRHLVNGTFQSQPASQLVRTIVEQYGNLGIGSEPFTTNNVKNNPAALPLMQFVYQTPSQVLAQIAQMTGWGFYVDSYRDVHYYDTQTFTSPLPNNTLDADDLYNDPTLAGGTGSGVYPNWIDLTIGEDTSQVKNRCYISGILVAQQTLYTEQFLGDGTTTTFVLGYQAPADTTRITVSVGSTPYQIGLDLIDSTPGGPCDAGTAYVNFQQQTIRFCSPPPAGAVITVKYYPMNPVAVRLTDAAAQAVMAQRTGTDGAFEYNRFDPSLSAELPSLAYHRARMTLFKYSEPYGTLHFTSFLQGWIPGQWFTFHSKRRFSGDYDGVPFYVNRVQKTLFMVAGGQWTWRYEIDAATRPFEI